MCCACLAFAQQFSKRLIILLWHFEVLVSLNVICNKKNKIWTWEHWNYFTVYRMNYCQEGVRLVPFLTRGKYMLVFEYSHVSTHKAQRTFIDSIVKINWFPSLQKTDACCLASFLSKLALDVPKLRLNCPGIFEATLLMKLKPQINKLKVFRL